MHCPSVHLTSIVLDTGFFTSCKVNGCNVARSGPGLVLVVALVVRRKAAMMSTDKMIAVLRRDICFIYLVKVGCVVTGDRSWMMDQSAMGWDS